VVLDWTVGLDRPRLPNDAAVLALQRELLARHPALLAGLAGPKAAGAQHDEDGHVDG
jgi:hypothetical protein